MSVTRVGVTKYTPANSAAGSATTRPLALPAGIQDGDTIFVEITSPSGSAANDPTVTGISGLVAIGNQSFSGHRHKLYIKENAVAADAGKTLTIATAAALRLSVATSVYRGAENVDSYDVLAVNGPASATGSITTPTVATEGPSSVELQFVGSSGGASGVTALGMPAGLTRVVESYDPFTTGPASLSSGENLASIPAGGNPGGDVWTSTGTSLLSAFTVALKAKVSATSSRPSSTITGTGWTAVGNATLHGALADDSDTSYAETGDNPDGSQPLLVANSTPLAAGNFTVLSRLAAPPGVPSIVGTVQLYQGTTLIASRQKTVEATPTDFTWTTTTAETALVTDSSQLRVRYVGVTQA